MGMTINAETAQLILDAIAWSNMEWEDALDWAGQGSHSVEMDRADFIRFCKARGIDTVERTIHVKNPVKGVFGNED